MLLAKKQGGNRYQFYIESIDQKHKDSKRLEKNLLHALEQNQMRMVYQPQVDLKTDEIVAIEALGRWVHPRYGLVNPDVYINELEQIGMIERYTTWAIGTALKNAITLPVISH